MYIYVCVCIYIWAFAPRLVARNSEENDYSDITTSASPYIHMCIHIHIY